MLNDVLKLVQSRTGLNDVDALREVNFAWRELWDMDDLPGSLWEVSISPENQVPPRMSLPWYIGQIRGVKMNWQRERMTLNTPHVYYQNNEYYQSPFTWRILGKSPLMRSITNATRLDLTLGQNESAIVSVTIIGPTDTAAQTTETIVFPIGTRTKSTVNNFVDINSITKSTITANDISVKDSLGQEIAILPNSEYEASNTIVQILDKCMGTCFTCGCFDIFYKLPLPILYNVNQLIPNESALVHKTLELITLNKPDQMPLAAAYHQKADGMLANANANAAWGISMPLDLGNSPFNTKYYGDI